MLRRSLLTATALSAARILGANDKIRVAVIGTGARGRFLTREFKEFGAVVSTVCDVYEPNLARGLKAASTGAKPCHDYRRALEDSAVDAVIIATPDHWHAKMTVDALDAGKDVYVEKPMANSIADGFRMVEAVRRTRRVLQVGTQRRSSELFIDAARVVRSGRAGVVRLVNSWWLDKYPGVERAQLTGKLDWKQWLRPAPDHALDPRRFFHWLWYWDYSAGFIPGWGSHIVDEIHMLMGSTAPLAVTCAGGGVYTEGTEVPRTTCMITEYPENYLAVFTAAGESMHYNFVKDQLIQIHGTKARLDVGREVYRLFPQSDALEVEPALDVHMPRSFAAATSIHIRNFLDCIRSRTDPNGTVEMGQSATIVMCMARDSLRSGRRLRWNPRTRKVES